MKKKLSIGLLIIVVALLLGYWLLWPKSKNIPSEPPSSKVEIQKRAEELQVALEEARDEKDREAFKAISEELRGLVPSRSFAQWQLAQSFITGISFYGKVVDQHGEPVTGASIDVSIAGGGPFAPGRGGGITRPTKRVCSMLKVKVRQFLF